MLFSSTGAYSAAPADTWVDLARGAVCSIDDSRPSMVRSLPAVVRGDCDEPPYHAVASCHLSCTLLLGAALIRCEIKPDCILIRSYAPELIHEESLPLATPKSAFLVISSPRCFYVIVGKRRTFSADTVVDLTGFYCIRVESPTRFVHTFCPVHGFSTFWPVYAVALLSDTLILEHHLFHRISGVDGSGAVVGKKCKKLLSHLVYVDRHYLGFVTPKDWLEFFSMERQQLLLVPYEQLPQLVSEPWRPGLHFKFYEFIDDGFRHFLRYWYHSYRFVKFNLESPASAIFCSDNIMTYFMGETTKRHRVHFMNYNRPLALCTLRRDDEAATVTVTWIKKPRWY